MRIAYLSIPLLLLAACPGGHDDPGIVFSDAEQAQIDRAIDAATGRDLELPFEAAQWIAQSFVETPGQACPQLIVDGGTLTATGGCDVDGVTFFEGTVVIDNWEPLTREEQLPEEPISVRFDDFRVTDDGERFAIDGTLALDGIDEIRGDLAVEMRGIAVQSRIALDCSDNFAPEPAVGCVRLEDSWIAIDGVGEADVSGGTDLVGEPDGVITLDGADVLTVDFDVEAICVPYQIDGEDAGEWCPADVF